MQKHIKPLLAGVMSSCITILGSQQCGAIDSSSTLEPEMIAFESLEKGDTTSGQDKKDLTLNSIKTTFPEAPISEIVLHEGAIKTVEISKNVINWISATENIVGIRYDEGVDNFAADYDGNNCYLRYSGKKLLVYIMTENAVYPTWLVPSDISAVHIELKKNNPLQANHNDPSFEQKETTYSNNKETKLIEMVKLAYNSEAEPIALDKLREVNVIKGVQGYRYKSINFEDGMYVQIYLFRVAPTSADDSVAIQETDFLLPELCYYPIGVSIEFPNLKKDRFTRVFVLGSEKPQKEDVYGL